MAARRRRRRIQSDRVEEFDAATALEYLHGGLMRIEAVAHATSAAFEFAPRARSAAERREAERIYALAELTFEVVGEVLRESDEMVTALGEHLERRRGERKKNG